MPKVLGAALAAVATLMAGALLLVDSAACVVECRGDEDCAPPFFRCQQNVCVECLIPDDCATLYGEKRQCWHGFCCNQGERGCFIHELPPNPRSCTVPDDCVKAFGFLINDPGLGGCETSDDCPEPSVCDNDSLRQTGQFTSPPPYSQGDFQCRMPSASFCAANQCNECRTGQDCVALGRSECCCPGAPTGGYQCTPPSVNGCCSG